MHQLMASVLEKVIDAIRQIQKMPDKNDTTRRVGHDI